MRCEIVWVYGSGRGMVKGRKVEGVTGVGDIVNREVWVNTTVNSKRN